MNMKDKELFKVLEKHILEDENPSEFLNYLKKENLLEGSFLEILKDLEEVNQEKKYHPEGNVWIHTMQVLDMAASLRNIAKDKREFMWAALLHDIGKKDATKIKKGRLVSYNHDNIGSNLSKEILKKVTEDSEFLNKVSNLIKYHMSYLYINKNLPFIKPEDLVKDCNLNDIALLTYCDRVGRGEKSLEDKRKILESINDFIVNINYKTNKNYKRLNI